MYVAGAFVRLLLLVAALAVSLMMPSALFGLCVVWPVVWLMWQWGPAEARTSAPTTFDVLVFLPYAIGAQGALDSLVPYAGDLVVLVGNLVVVAALRRPKLPVAKVVVRRPWPPSMMQRCSRWPARSSTRRSRTTRSPI
jgi:hypothetical protein